MILLDYIHAMPPSIDGLMQGEALKVGDGLVLNKRGAKELTDQCRTIPEMFIRKVAREGDIVTIREIRPLRGGTVVISTPFEHDWTTISRRDHDWFSARAPEHEAPSRRER